MRYYWIGDVRYYQPRVGLARRAMLQNPSAETRLAEGGPGVLEEKKRTIVNPYYIGGAQMLGPREQSAPLAPGSCLVHKPKWAKHTIEEAIQEAERRLAADPRLTEVSIVKIVRVVRRAKPVVAIDVEVVE